MGGLYRLYKFENADPEIQEVQIHLNRVSGSARVRVTREDPRLATNMGKETEPGDESSTIYAIKEDLTKPIYVTVMSITNCIFTLTATVRHNGHA